MIALIALLLAAPAEPLPLELSLRAGYARAFGNQGDAGAPLPFNNLVPLSVDIRYRIYRSFSLATSFEFAPALSCSGSSCSAAVFRVALGAHWQPREGEWRPFGALGAGYEWRRYSLHALVADLDGNVGDVELSRTARGVAFLVAQTGVERALSPSLRLGPYALFTLGSYSNEDIHYQPPIQPDQSRSPGGVHGYAQVGLRLSFEP